MRRVDQRLVRTLRLSTTGRTPYSDSVGVSIIDLEVKTVKEE